MNIEAGKSYALRNGEKVVVVDLNGGIEFPVRGVLTGANGDLAFKDWTSDGKYTRATSSVFDIVAEWSDISPVYVHFFKEGPVKITSYPANSVSGMEPVSRIKVAPQIGRFDD